MTAPGSDGQRARPVVLITGASSGLGLALARRLLAARTYRLVLTARSASLPRFAELGIIEQDGVWLRPLDVTRADERRAVVLEIEHGLGGVDVLVNNAGVAYRGVVEHFTEQSEHDQMDVNFHAPLDLIRRVLPSMQRKRAGRIINVSSVGGMMAMPTMALYSASKFALEGAIEGLWYEVRPFNVKVSLIEPGFIRSESFLNTRYTTASHRSLARPDEPYHGYYLHMSRMIAFLMRAGLNTPDDVAATICKTMRQEDPPLRVLATYDAHLFAWLRRLLPRRLYHYVLDWALWHIWAWNVPAGARLKEGLEHPS